MPTDVIFLYWHVYDRSQEMAAEDFTPSLPLQESQDTKIIFVGSQPDDANDEIAAKDLNLSTSIHKGLANSRTPSPHPLQDSRKLFPFHFLLNS